MVCKKCALVTFNLAITWLLVSCLHLIVTVGLSGPSPLIRSVGSWRQRSLRFGSVTWSWTSEKISKNMLSRALVTFLKKYIASYKQPKLILISHLLPRVAGLTLRNVTSQTSGRSSKHSFALSCWKEPVQVLWASDKNASLYRFSGQVQLGTDPEHTAGITYPSGLGRECLRRRRSGLFLFSLSYRLKMDEWIK